MHKPRGRGGFRIFIEVESPENLVDFSQWRVQGENCGDTRTPHIVSASPLLIWSLGWHPGWWHLIIHSEAGGLRTVSDRDRALNFL